MEYKFLGRSGLKVSSICINILNTASPKQINFDDLLQASIEKGINYFLAGNPSKSPRDIKDPLPQLGVAIKNLSLQRDSLVLATVLEDNNSPVYNRKKLTEITRDFLDKNAIKYLDILYCPRSEESVSIEELCRTMDWLLEKGYAFYWGTAGWSAEDIVEALDICERLNLHKYKKKCVSLFFVSLYCLTLHITIQADRRTLCI
jgi:aryl-alcohol dehydrogenase-like predicted oxidoreductase